MNTSIQENILAYLRNVNMAVNAFDLCDKIGAGMDLVQPALNELTAEGRLCITRKGKYILPEVMGLTPARASALRNGSPTAVLSETGETLRIRYADRTRCLPDDLILVRILNDSECELISIASRGKSQIPAFVRVEVRETRRLLPKRERKRLHKTSDVEKKTILSATACDRRITCPILLSPSDVEVRNNEIALISIDEYPDGDRPMLAHAVRVLGNKSDMRARLQVIAENHEFTPIRPADVLAQASALPRDPGEESFAGREDFRQMSIFTIDGPFSKDFDDAISLEKDGDCWRLGVHIADVSHYVLPGSPIDRDAIERGTSLYLPGLTIPMLPEILSDHLCSLMPGRDRLALSLFMKIRDGRVIDHHLCKSVIHSVARLTYDQVNRLYEGDQDAVPEALAQTLADMLTLAQSLRRNRFRQGCIELDLPESEFVLNEENVPTEICISERGESERLIEDFMLAANETIAMLARTTQTPLVYRIHEAPDEERLSSLSRYLALIGIQARLGASPHSGELQSLLSRASDHPAIDSIRRMLLRSMKRAQYSEKPLGHYALALEDYCHFTSPIRRYPDLVVHRMIKSLIDGKPAPSGESVMAGVSRQSSSREYESTLAEREADDVLKARFMSDRIGHKYVGTVTGVTAWGMYVTLENSVEGLVHIASLDDYYEYDRDHNLLIASGSGNTFRLGDHVRVRVEHADLDRGEIDFTLVPVLRRRA